MSIVGVATSYLVFIIAKKILPKVRGSIPLAAGIAACISVPVAATGFAIQYAIGGTGTEIKAATPAAKGIEPRTLGRIFLAIMKTR